MASEEAASEPSYHSLQEDAPDGDEWSKEAYRLLTQYRRSYDYETHRRSQQQQKLYKRPFETLETAFQVTCQVMVPLLAPRVHPFIRRFSQLLTFRRTYPEVLPAPSLSVLVAGLHAKFILDVANHCSLPPFRWVAHRPEPDEMLHPLSVYGIELNVLSGCAGVALGRLAVFLRQGFYGLALAMVAGLPGRVSTWVSPRVARIAPMAAILMHLHLCQAWAQPVVDTLAAQLHEAQIQNRSLMSITTSAIWQDSKLLIRNLLVSLGLWKVSPHDHGFTDEWWDGDSIDEKVPHDLLCPITGQLFVKPVVLHGSVFEEGAVTRWVATTGRHPLLLDIACRLEDIRAAPDVEELCRKLAATHGWALNSR
eukprot:TRINITY_DN113448_c0_g1_i1.p1 TRINITY_DN113448_c0_g1~~TRINITY_DN113448_c0_g1_i1.p1  ORF type:complete len:374 (-),score=42.85 TRINITY_DN113448_c0_g1_i1:104-1201(-)